MTLIQVKSFVSNHKKLNAIWQLIEKSVRQSVKQGLKKCKFPGKFGETSRGPHVEDDENVALKSLNYHCVHADQLALIQLTSISSYSTCKQLHRLGVPRYRSVRKNEILKECKTHGSGNLHREVVNFSCLILA